MSESEEIVQPPVDPMDRPVTRRQVYELLVTARLLAGMLLLVICLVIMGWGAVGEDVRELNRYKQLQKSINLYSVETLEDHESRVQWVEDRIKNARKASEAVK